MNKKRIVIHIGTHKTGTTSIQRALYLGRDKLAAAGLLYPSTDHDRGLRNKLRKHGHLSAVAREGKPEACARERKLLLDEFEASGAHTMVISEEGLSSPNPQSVEFFRPLAQQYDITAVCYLRRQDLFIESFFNQVVKRGEMGENRSIVDFINDPVSRMRLDYHAMLMRWRAMPAQVVALDFAGEVKKGGLVASFLQAAGLPALGLSEEVANASPDMRLVQIFQELERQGLDFDERRLMRVGRRLATQGTQPLMKTALGSDQRQRLLVDYAASNTRLAADFGVRFDERMPTEPQQPLIGVDAVYLMNMLGGISMRGPKIELPEEPERAA